MDHEGIYRKTGGASQIRAIVVAFEQGSEIDLINMEQDDILDICSITSVLKQYFRELPNPLLTFELYTLLLEAVGEFWLYITINVLVVNSFN